MSPTPRTGERSLLHGVEPPGVARALRDARPTLTAERADAGTASNTRAPTEARAVMPA
ncbi:hypothetical protein [Streptomyces kanamyceticus]|uniref:hypothetical protein n=1 Tax=Streptomyces kanamyceticus TaxID=1967 RepID=UPI0037DCC912